MEKPPKAKSMFLRFLPKAASAVTFQNHPPFSPDKKRLDVMMHSNKLKTLAGKGFSGPVISIIPAEVRQKAESPISFEAQEPTSPKVGCMGQIKHKKKMMKKEEKHETHPKELKPVSSAQNNDTVTFRGKLFSGAKPQGRKSDASADRFALPDRAPSLSQMKRFASGRDSTRTFDWAAQIKPVDTDVGDYYSDEESAGEGREVIIPFSAPILVVVGGGGGGGGGGVAMEPRKEINLWKRRTMAQPRPLQLNTLVRSI